MFECIGVALCTAKVPSWIVLFRGRKCTTKVNRAPMGQAVSLDAGQRLQLIDTPMATLHTLLPALFIYPSSRFSISMEKKPLLGSLCLPVGLLPVVFLTSPSLSETRYREIGPSHCPHSPICNDLEIS